jgi:hypothetical protein
MDAVDLINMQIHLEYQVDREGYLVFFPGSSQKARYLVRVVAAWEWSGMQMWWDMKQKGERNENSF